MSDDTKLQRIIDVLQKMDVDHDGAVEVDHVLKVILFIFFIIKCLCIWKIEMPNYIKKLVNWWNLKQSGTYIKHFFYKDFLCYILLENAYLMKETY